MQIGINFNGEYARSEAFILNSKISSVFILLLISSIIIFFCNNNLTNIPEIQLYNNQTLKVLIPSKKCSRSLPKALYFTSDLRNNTKEYIHNNRLINYKNTKNSFVTYYSDDHDYDQFDGLLAEHGIIKSDDIYGEHNFFLSKKAVNLIKDKKEFFKVDNSQKFYRFADFTFFRKDNIYINYQKMKMIFNKDYNYMPETYYFPNDQKIIKNKFERYILDPNDLWLIKPTNKSGGSGIYILNSLYKIKEQEFMISKYIANVDLINHKKYDLRLYVLISGLKPLRIYLYKEGLIRIASNNYTLNKSSLGNKYIHLTNTAINSKNKDYINPNNTADENANMWSLDMYANHLKKKGVDFQIIKRKIKDIIIKSFISTYKNLTEELDRNNLNDINFYNVLGYDIIIKDNYEPILLEINSGPCLKWKNEVDKIIKTNLFVDTLNIIGISHFSKNFFYHFIKKENNDYENYKYSLNNAFCELMRPRGDYELIFPIKNNINKYKKYFKNNFKENIIFWEKIIEDD